MRSLVVTAFNNIGLPNSFQLLAINTRSADACSDQLIGASKFVWGSTGLLVLSDSVWQAMLQNFKPKITSERSGYLHLLYLNPDEPPLLTLKVDDLSLGLKSFCEYIKWMILEASYFEVRRIDTIPV